jgi:Fe2+ transport system protein FeoA
VGELIPLGLLNRGQLGEIGQLVGDVGDVHRLSELGLRQGVRVRMVQPGSPCIVQLEGQRLCFRDGDSLSVFVRAGESY